MRGGLCGILLVDKPAGATSHDVVQFVRWALRERAVGHFGTLDPSATGLLVVGLGAATRLGPWLTGLDKRYRARVVLGRATSTEDAEGETIAEAPCPEGTIERALEVARGLAGTLHLTPPSVSAIRIEGRRAHDMVRAGEDVTLEPREMIVHAVEVLGAGPGEAASTVVVDLVLHVSKGSYVRSIAVELGRRLGLPAHLGALRRLAVGRLALEDPRVVDGLQVEPGPKAQARVLLPVAASEEPRDVARARLLARLAGPTAGLSIPVCTIAPGPDGEAVRRAFGYGQSLAPGPAALEPPMPAEDGFVALVAPAPSALEPPGTPPEVLAVAFVDAAILRPRRLILGLKPPRKRA
jgi:tRNA pseudouridine55 synthase